MSTSDEISLLVRALARHWRAYPFASDTREGIAHWWLYLPPGWNWRLQIALDRMVEEGVVQRLQAADGRVRYRRLRVTDGIDGIDEALKRLADEDGPDNGKGDA